MKHSINKCSNNEESNEADTEKTKLNTQHFIPLLPKIETTGVRNAMQLVKKDVMVVTTTSLRRN